MIDEERSLERKRVEGASMKLAEPLDRVKPTLVKARAKTGAKQVLPMSMAMWQGDAITFLRELPTQQLFDLVVTSPPYNIGKSYEVRRSLDSYLTEQALIIDEIIPRLKDGGSICWQVGNYVEQNEIFPLDIEFAPLFRKHTSLRMRNRIVWTFGHGLHTQKRFSGRYETVLWFTKTADRRDGYTFNLDPVRVPSKYPGKRHFKGPNVGKLSGHPLGKNPEDVWSLPSDDVWSIPNVKSNHVEKTEHPCQFPVGLIERLVLALTNAGDLVFDPFAGVASAGVAAAVHGRRFWGCEVMAEFARTGVKRLAGALDGSLQYRPHDKPIYDHSKSSLSMRPEPDSPGRSQQQNQRGLK
jgi:adenine-specific DNA-methyltransferase